MPKRSWRTKNRTRFAFSKLFIYRNGVTRSPFINDVKVTLDEKHRMHNENGDYFPFHLLKS